MTHRDLAQILAAFENFSFERFHVDLRRVFFQVEGHVHKAGIEEFDILEPGIEGLGFQHPLQQFHRHRFAGLIVGSIGLENFRLGQPVLENLRMEFDKVAVHRCARQGRILGIGQDAMQAVAELMEERRRIGEGDQRRLALRRPVVVAIVQDQRNFAGNPVLGPERAHPGAGTLALAGEIVAVEQGDHITFGVMDFPDANIGMIDRNVVALVEADIEQAPGRVEHRVDHAVELKILGHFGRIDAVTLLAHALGIVAPVPALGFKIAAFGIDHGLNVGQLFERALAGRPPDLFHQVDGRFGRFGHRAGGAVMRPALKAQQLRLFLAQHQNIADQLVIVELVVVIAAIVEAAPGTLAKLAIRRGFKEGLHAGTVQRDDGPVHVTRTGSGARSTHHGGGQVLQRALRQFHVPALAVAQLVLGELRVERGQLGTDFRIARALLHAQLRTGAHKLVMGHFQKAGLLLRQAEIGAVLVERVDAGKQITIQRDGRAVAGQHRAHFALDGAQLVIGRRTRQIAEHGGNPAKATARHFHGQHGVFEGRLLGIAGNGGDLGRMIGNRGLKRRHEVCFVDLVQRRCAEILGPLLGKRIIVQRGQRAAFRGRRGSGISRRVRSGHFSFACAVFFRCRGRRWLLAGCQHQGCGGCAVHQTINHILTFGMVRGVQFRKSAGILALCADN